MQKVTVCLQFFIEVEVEDRNDISELARTAKPILIDRINSDSIGENVIDVVNGWGD